MYTNEKQYYNFKMSDQSERGKTKYNKDWENPSLHSEIAE